MTNRITLILIAAALYGCSTTDSPGLTPETPSINDIVFTSQSTADVYVDGSADVNEVTYTDQNGAENSIESSDDPVAVNVPFGHVLEFKVRGKNNNANKASEYSTSTKVLASTNSDEGINRMEFLEAVNEMRSQGFKCGSTDMPMVGKLVWDDQLELLSKPHAKDMDENNFLDGTGSDGKTYGQRIKEVFQDCQAYRELLAQGPNVEFVFQGWQNSEGACKYLMEDDMRYLSVAKSGSKWVVDLRE